MTLVCFSFPVGIVFFTLGKFRLGVLVGFFPRYVPFIDQPLTLSD
jgi:MFS superfamily sulfate permease-like transporter